MRIFLLCISIFVAVSVLCQDTPPANISPPEQQFFVCTPEAWFPGGGDSLLSFLTRQIHYPTIESVSGRVVVVFIVNEDGSVSDVEIKRSLDPAFDEEALRVVKMLPRFIPASLNGKHIKTQYTIPINFSLKE